MSPNVGNFVHDLVEMAKAMETLPQVQHELAEAKGTIENLQQAVQDRELRATDYKAQIEELQTKVRATEAERDDAELRFLDLEEKSAKVVSFLGQVQGMAVQAEVLLNPPKPQPEPEPVVDHAAEALAAEPFQPQDQSEAPPTSSTGSSQGSENAQGSSNSIEQPSPQSPASQGQGEVNPTHGNEPSQNAAGTTTTSSAQTGEGSEPQPGPYAGKYYSNHPVYVRLDDWIAGGGTEHNYYAGRPVGPSGV